MQFEWPKTGFRLSSDKTDLRPKSYTKFQISCLISLANADNLKIYQRFIEFLIVCTFISMLLSMAVINTTELRRHL